MKPSRFRRKTDHHKIAGAEAEIADGSDASCAHSAIIDRAMASLANRSGFKCAVFSRVARA